MTNNAAARTMRADDQRVGSRAVKSTGTKIFDVIVVIISLIGVALCLLPMLNLLTVSMSAERSIINKVVYFWPVQIDMTAYTNVFHDAAMRLSLLFTVLLTITSTAFSMFMTIMCAYPLSQRRFVGRPVFSTLVIVTMYFSAGIVPDYINMKNLGLLDTFYVLVLPAGIGVFNMIILKSFFQSVPPSLQESAEIDGANHWIVLLRIYLPLSGSALATIALFYAVGRWNGFSDARLYISNPRLYPIQMKLYQVLQAQTSLDATLEGVPLKVATESIKAASIMFATIPILIVYPFLQKYFVKGVTVGAVKG